MKREKLKLSTILSYALATGSGYQIMGSLVGAYLMIFLTDTFGVPAGAVGVITVVASVWDAINDPMMGTIADRTKSRWGKYRPYFLFIPAILKVVVVLLFASPNIGTHGKIIWTAVFYILYGMLRTAIEIPSGALINAVTDEPSERSKMINAYTMVMGICTTIATSFGLSLVSLFGGDNTAKGYMIVVGLAGVIMTITCWMCFATTKETCVQHNEQKPLLEEIKNDASESAPDLLAASSHVLLAMLSDCTDTLPPYVRPLTLEDYFSEKVTGRYAMTTIRNAWKTSRTSFEISERANELRYNAGAPWEADRILKELPETLEAHKSRDWVVMNLEEARNFFTVPFKKSWLNRFRKEYKIVTHNGLGSFPLPGLFSYGF